MKYKKYNSDFFYFTYVARFHNTYGVTEKEILARNIIEAREKAHRMASKFDHMIQVSFLE